MCLVCLKLFRGLPICTTRSKSFKGLEGEELEIILNVSKI